MFNKYSGITQIKLFSSAFQSLLSSALLMVGSGVLLRGEVLPNISGHLFRLFFKLNISLTTERLC